MCCLDKLITNYYNQFFKKHDIAPIYTLRQIEVCLEIIKVIVHFGYGSCNGNIYSDVTQVR